MAIFLTFRRQTAYLIVGKFCEFCEKITTKKSLNSQNLPTEKKQSRWPLLDEQFLGRGAGGGGEGDEVGALRLATEVECDCLIV